MCNNVRERLQYTLNNSPASGLVILILILYCRTFPFSTSSYISSSWSFALTVGVGGIAAVRRTIDGAAGPRDGIGGRVVSALPEGAWGACFVAICE